MHHRSQHHILIEHKYKQNQIYYNFRDIQSIETFLVRRMFLNSKNIPTTKEALFLNAYLFIGTFGVTIMPINSSTLKIGYQQISFICRNGTFVFVNTCRLGLVFAFDARSRNSVETPRNRISICIIIYKGLPPMKSDHLRTSPGMPSFRGSFSLMQRAKS
jgi:hypothetical protein